MKNTFGLLLCIMLYAITGASQKATTGIHKEQKKAQVIIKAQPLSSGCINDFAKCLNYSMQYGTGESKRLLDYALYSRGSLDFDDKLAMQNIKDNKKNFNKAIIYIHSAIRNRQSFCFLLQGIYVEKKYINEIADYAERYCDPSNLTGKTYLEIRLFQKSIRDKRLIGLTNKLPFIGSKTFLFNGDNEYYYKITIDTNKRVSIKLMPTTKNEFYHNKNKPVQKEDIGIYDEGSVITKKNTFNDEYTEYVIYKDSVFICDLNEYEDGYAFKGLLYYSGSVDTESIQIKNMKIIIQIGLLDSFQTILRFF